MKSQSIVYVLKIGIALVWFVNGLYCKILNFVPRHEEIVGTLLNEGYAPLLTNLIGVGEMLIGVWILSGWNSKWCAIFQICLVLLMNIIEFTFVSELLLHGRLNLIFAVLFSLFIYVVYFKLVPKETV